MEPHLNIWIEQNGTVVLSEWRVQLWKRSSKPDRSMARPQS